MKEHRDFELGAGEPPEGWTPEGDVDPRWRRIAELAREAGEAPRVPPARFEAMKLSVQRQLREEGILREDAAAPASSFGAWLHNLLLGGGWGGQLVRFGVVGALAFAAGQMPVGSGTNVEKSAVVATAPEKAPDSKGTEVASAPKPAPIQGFAIERSSRGGSAPAGDSVDWMSTVPQSGPAASFGDPGMVTVSTAPANPPARNFDRNLAAEAFDQLQVVKFYSLVQQDERQLAEIRRVEQLIGQMMTGDDAAATSPEVQGQELYRVGEQLLAARRYGEAIDVFERAAGIMPDSPLGFLARFQVGRIAFENTRDYTLAVESFKACRDNYPSHFGNERYQAFLNEHLQVLDQTATGNWETLRLWQDAKAAATPLKALDLLIKVVASSQSPVLAVDASDRIREILLTDLAVPEEMIEAALEGLAARVEGAPAGSATARIQFNRAEITSRRRPGDLSSVAAEYARVLQLGPDENVARAASIRLNLIQSRLDPQRSLQGP